MSSSLFISNSENSSSQKKIKKKVSVVILQEVDFLLSSYMH